MPARERRRVCLLCQTQVPVRGCVPTGGYSEVECLTDDGQPSVRFVANDRDAWVCRECYGELAPKRYSECIMTGHWGGSCPFLACRHAIGDGRCSLEIAGELEKRRAGMTLEAVAETMSVVRSGRRHFLSRERVRQIEESAIAKLAEKLGVDRAEIPARRTWHLRVVEAG